MPKGPGTYGTTKGRPPKKRTSTKTNTRTNTRANTRIRSGKR